MDQDAAATGEHYGQRSFMSDDMVLASYPRRTHKNHDCCVSIRPARDLCERRRYQGCAFERYTVAGEHTSSLCLHVHESDGIDSITRPR